MILNDTIYALSSGSGRAGIAVIRISGSGTATLLENMCVAVPEPRKAVLKTITHPRSGDILDQCVVIWLPAPASFSGEDMAELHVHGGFAVVEGVLSAIGSLEGTRMAEAGEFTRRAFHNDKLDLIGIEAIADLVEAETAAQKKQALRQMQGGLGDVLDGWRARLIHILAYVEAGIDFSDEEDIPEDVNQNLISNIHQLNSEICRVLEDGRSGERLRSGLQVVIAGPPNAGKSSLLNVLAKRDVAIVSEQAGTTRDIIEVHLDLNGFPVTLFDTAGLREIKDSVEEEGVRRARSKIGNADVVLWTTDSSVAEDSCDFEIDSDQILIRLRNKCDLESATAESDRKCNENWGESPLLMSAKTGIGLDKLLHSIAAIAGDLQASGVDAVITRNRHREALTRVVAYLAEITAKPGMPDEIIAESLRSAARELGRLTGRVDVEDLLDVIFNDFCVGK